MVFAKLNTRVEGFRHAFTSKKAFVKFFETKASIKGDPDEVRNKWSNEDLELSPLSHQTWRWFDYSSFWWTYGFSPGTWFVGSSLLAIGLTAWQALICIFLGYSFGAIGVVLHSRSASVYHFGFPVESRIVWGLRGAAFPVLLRALTALIWAGVTITQGGYHTAVLLRCIFGDSYWKLPNHIPKSSAITIQQLIAIIIYWIMTAWLIEIPIPKLRRWFEVKAVILPPTIIGLFIWCMLKGSGAPVKSAYTIKPMTGAKLAWAMVSGVNAVMGKTSTLQVNQPDIARYARSRSSPIWSQLIALPLGNFACSAMGIYATQRIFNAWGNLDWNPWTLNHDMLNHDFGAGTRTGLAIMNILFMYSNAMSELGANLIPFGADFMSLFPRWLNIKRAMWLCYCLSVAICPWYILASATGFVKFLNGYGIFIGPILGIFLLDYFFVRKGNVFVEDLYKQGGRYWYFHGIAWRPFVAYFAVVATVLPGFLRSFGYTFAGAAEFAHFYSFNWFYVVIASGVIYSALGFIGNYAKEERSMRFEELLDTLVIDGEELKESSSDVSMVAVQMNHKV